MKVADRRWGWLIFLPLAVFLGVDRLAPFPLANLRRPAATIVTDSRGEPIRFFLPPDHRWRFPAELAELGSELPRALVAVEDRRFHRHLGVDPLAILRALGQNLAARRVVSGASTLPMQLARMADPAPRTVLSKAREAFRALQLTFHHDRDELLELYLTNAPYGGNVEGVTAAAWFYFGKTPKGLSAGEIALLVALPRSPRGFDPTLHPERARTERDRVLGVLEAEGVITATQATNGRAQPLPRERRKPPFAAPHFALLAARTAGGRVGPEVGRSRRERQNGVASDLRTDTPSSSAPTASLETKAEDVSGVRSAGESNATPFRLSLRERSTPLPTEPPHRIVTTLDSRAQRSMEEIVARHMGELRGRGLGNAAAVAIDVPNRTVRALVGSADFFDDEHDGQIDGTRALRSPGSTLKPVLYAQAFDRGVALPDGLLLDVPTDFDGYLVENFDGRYRGRVTARMALVESLNTPAVRLLSAVGVADFLDLLHRGGLATLDRTAEEYGLPLVLGGGEVRLLDLVNLYASLADGGRHRPLTWLAGAPAGREERLVSETAAADVGSILRGLARPDLPSTWDLTVGAPAVAWKTGTSFGHRDAWAIGFSGRTAIGVWVGSFDGRAHLGISGGEHAGPILFDLFRVLDPGAAPLPEPVAERPRLQVCAHSRQLPGAHCPERITVDAYPATRLAICAVHRRALVDIQTGELLSGDCLRDRQHRWQVFTLEPAELVAWWRASGRRVVDLPSYSRACRGIPSGRGPRIVSPDPDTPYRLRPEAPLEFQKIALTAEVAPGVTQLWWYQDGRLLATGAPGEALFVPPVQGRHRLVATDDGGRSGVVVYRVE